MTQTQYANIARKTFEIPKVKDPKISTSAPQFSYEEVQALLERQREIIAERIERGS